MSDEVRKRASRLNEAIQELDSSLVGDAAEAKDRLLADTSFLREVLNSALALCAKELAEVPAERASEAVPGTRFGRFEVLGVLGQGGMGTVHLAFDTLLQRRVALKLVRHELVLSTEARRRFVREARIVSSLDHPNICRVFDTGEHEGLPFLVMQLVEGRTLAEHIDEARKHGGRILERAGSTGLDAVLAVIEELARALHYAHERGLLHRDVKPANIMIRTDGVPVLLDFGLARDTQTEDGVTMSHQVLGTRAYMSPEQVLGRTTSLDPRTDVYSLAVTLYEACTGVRPFEAGSDLELGNRIVHGRARTARALNRALPQDLDRVLTVAMEPEPSRRYASSLAFAEDLRRVRMREPILGRPPGLSTRAIRWMQRNPVVATLLAVTSVMLVIVGWLYWVASERLSDFDSVACVTRLEQLRKRSDELHPAWPRNAGALKALLADSQTFLSELEHHRGRLAAVAARARPGEGGGPSFASLRDAYVHTALAKVVDELDDFRAKDLKDIEHRTITASSILLANTSVDGRAWAEVRREIASSREYAHLDLPPQVGLVPLGKDPTSGFHEFADVQSGEPPTRDPITQELVLDEASAVVFVLLPGRTVLIGEQFEFPCLPHYQAPMKLPARTSLGGVELEAFLIGKHEVNQAQWMRISRSTNPSQHKTPRTYYGCVTTDMHPVERVSSLECEAVFHRVGWLLPTEAQWEYACRAGTATTWWTGASVTSLSGAENLPDAAAAAATTWGGAVTSIHDGFVVHAPIDALLPNPFGLHGMHGNVMEWCRDYDETSAAEWLGAEVVDLEGQKLVASRKFRARRGGSYDSSQIIHSRAACRWPTSPDATDGDVGCRAIRRILKGS